jgi:hypothetical protein
MRTIFAIVLCVFVLASAVSACCSTMPGAGGATGASSDAGAPACGLGPACATSADCSSYAAACCPADTTGVCSAEPSWVTDAGAACSCT